MSNNQSRTLKIVAIFIFIISLFPPFSKEESVYDKTTDQYLGKLYEYQFSFVFYPPSDSRDVGFEINWSFLLYEYLAILLPGFLIYVSQSNSTKNKSNSYLSKIKTNLARDPAITFMSFTIILLTILVLIFILS